MLDLYDYQPVILVVLAIPRRLRLHLSTRMLSCSVFDVRLRNTVLIIYAFNHWINI